MYLAGSEGDAELANDTFHSNTATCGLDVFVNGSKFRKTNTTADVERVLVQPGIFPTGTVGFIIVFTIKVAALVIAIVRRLVGVNKCAFLKTQEIIKSLTPKIQAPDLTPRRNKKKKIQSQHQVRPA